MCKRLITILMPTVFLLGLALFVGCESDAGTGALLGSGIGAGVGALAGGDSEATLIGAAVGGAVGYGLGNEGDKKKAASSAAAEREQLRREINTVNVKVTNSNGSMIMVPVRRQGVGYIGPRGEYYDHLPTEAELKPLYGF